MVNCKNTQLVCYNKYLKKNYDANKKNILIAQDVFTI